MIDYEHPAMPINCTFLLNGQPLTSLYVNGVRRGMFRLHPIGPQRRSEGCIALVNPTQFKQLSAYLRSGGPTLTVPGTSAKAYGTLEVR